MTSAIVLFDGVCNFCNSTLNFIMDHDPAGYFKFAALQSEAGKRLLEEYKVDASLLDTLILIEDGKICTHSTAVLRIFRKLSGCHSILYDFIVIPEFIRDPLYKFFAKYRYKIFGKRENCRIPKEEERMRFL